MFASTEVKPKLKSKIKICGNHLPTDLSLLEKYAQYIDYIGFIFTPISKRYIDPYTVAFWMENYPLLGEKAVAVFLNQDLKEVKDILQQTKINRVQLHGHESSAYCLQLKKECAMIVGEKIEVWKVIPVEDGQVVPLEQYLPIVDTLLLDTKIKDSVGGTGQPFDWTVIGKVQEITVKRALPLFVAGGINPNNVAELLAAYAVDGIDLASGVETDLAKDEQKLVNLIKGVKRDGGDNVYLSRFIWKIWNFWW